MAHRSEADTDSYFKRFGYWERQIETPAHSDLGIVTVVPCHDEPDLITCLNSLWACRRPMQAIEVIVVLNSSVSAPPKILDQNRKSFSEFAAWREQHRDERFESFLLNASGLPPKQAGVGLARKIGMDEAVRRFTDVGRPNGVVVSFDADCTCDPDYFTAIESCFQVPVPPPGCSIYFEHPLAGPLDPEIYQAVSVYELHLRYYVHALRYAGFPYAHHTVGSSMAVRADTYQQQGGMNRRKAGEDFYFLQKVIPLGGFQDLRTTRVIPSPRPSHRVPFGTGKAVRDYIESRTARTYPFQAFSDLKEFFEALPALYRSDDPSGIVNQGSMPRTIAAFLNELNFPNVIGEIHKNTAGERAFLKRFFHWFNGFRAMQFIHFARDKFYGPGSPEIDPAVLLSRYFPQGATDPRAETVEGLLTVYRKLDREGTNHGCRPDPFS